MSEERVTLGDVTEATVDKSGPRGKSFVYVDIGSVDREKKIIAESNVIESAAAPSRAKQVLQNGDVLVSMTRPNLNAVALVTPEFHSAIGSTGFHVLRSKCVEPKFLFYLVQTRKFIDEMCLCVQGALYPAVRPKDISSFAFFLPSSLPAQRAVVAKIEELFSELDKGIENLKTAQAQLKVYRQALLKHAFEGKLTAQWREQNRDQLETAAALQKRIQQERAQRYQQQLAAWEKSKSPSVPLCKSGKTSAAAATRSAVPHFDKGGLGGISAQTAMTSKPKAPKPLPPITAEELAELPELPEGWAWTRLGSTNVEVSDGPFGSNLKSSDYVDSGVRVVRLENIGALKFIEEKESYVTEQKYESLKRHTVTSGDIVFSSFIIENVRVALVPPSITKAINKADCFCVRFSGETLSNVYAVLFLSTRHVYKQLESLIHGVGRPRINTTQLKDVVIPICGAAEQQVIIAEIESRLSEVDQLDLTITTSLQQAEALRQSILKKAFSGHLMPQDSHDEPASVLLARIRAERATAEESSVVRTRSKRG